MNRAAPNQSKMLKTGVPLTAHQREQMLNLRRDLIALLRMIEEILGMAPSIPKRRR